MLLLIGLSLLASCVQRSASDGCHGWLFMVGWALPVKSNLGWPVAETSDNRGCRQRPMSFIKIRRSRADSFRLRGSPINACGLGCTSKFGMTMLYTPPIVLTSGGREAAESKRPLRRALELRYQVYCVERSFLEADDYPDGVETDEYDEAAAHFHAFDEARELVGYVRLISPDADRRFPLQQHCGSFADGVQLPPAHQAAEISRLMIRGDFRRQRGSSRLLGVTAEENNAILSGSRRFETPNILLGLYKQMYIHSLASGIRYWYAAMERPLARSLARAGFNFEPIGPETDYYGPVSPYLADLRKLEESVAARQPDLLAWMTSPTQMPPPLRSEFAPPPHHVGAIRFGDVGGSGEWGAMQARVQG